MLRKALFSILVLLGSSLGWAQTTTPFTNLQDFVTHYGFAHYYKTKPANRVKVAIFDVDFSGYQAALGKSLPPKVVFANEKIDPDLDSRSKGHGKIMAEMIYALMTDGGRHPELAPEFYFYQITGLISIREAIASAISTKIQIILNSTVRSFGSNWDGKGWLNREVDQATSNGIIWVNAAGDFAHQTFNAPIVFHKDSRVDTVGWVNLPDPQSSISFMCQAPAGSKCTADIVLSWNSFNDDTRHGTNKDLDLFLLNSSYEKLADSSAEQVAVEHGETEELAPGKGAECFHWPPVAPEKIVATDECKRATLAREHIKWEVDPGIYNLMVLSRNPSVFGANDKLRIVVDGENLLLNHDDVDESLLNPADNPSVITVGSLPEANRPNRTAVSRKLSKPELLTDSVVKFQNGLELAGNSNSAAVVAAGFALLKAEKPTLTRQQLLDETSSYPGQMNGVFSLP